MTANLCPFVDDTVEEASAIAAQLRGNGFPFEIQPVMPDMTTDKTLQFIKAAKPKAAIVDYVLFGRPHVKTDQLAMQLIRAGVPAVLVTKDRDIADEGERQIQGVTVPIYFKRALKDAATFARFCESLHAGVAAPIVPGPDEFARLSALQDKAFLGALAPEEATEAELLMARLRLVEREELGHLEAAQVGIDKSFSALLENMKRLREDIDKELRQKPD